MLGKQGAGKGTQCVRLSRHYVVPHISTGDMFRASIRTGTRLGVQVQSYIDSGNLIPDDLVISVIADRLSQPDTLGRGFVLDGFPRTVPQAERLGDLVRPHHLDLVVNITVPTSLVLERLATRMVCVDCQTNYSPEQSPKVQGVCDVCGGEVIHRKDDNEEAIRRRLELYETQTQPLIDYYSDRGILLEVDGVGPVDDVTLRLIQNLDEYLVKGRTHES